MLCRALLACLLLTSATLWAADWPQFRGPTADGHVTDHGYPLKWSETENIAWKVELPGLGWSSPAIVGEQIWLTTAVDNGKPIPPPPVVVNPNADKAKDAKAKAPPPKPEEGKSLRVLCLDRATGKVIHNLEVFDKESPGTIHKKNSHASPTPIIEGNRVYVHFGSHGTACVSTDGKLLWRTTQLKYNHRHGPGGSPVIYKDLLILSCDGTDVQYVVALDKATGEIRWKSDRAQSKMAYTTPLLVTVNGQDQVISTGGRFVGGYEPLTGKELWRVHYDEGYSLVPRPVVGHGLAFICTGYDRPLLYAVKLGGQGDVTETNVVWKLDKGAPLNPSPLLVGNELYIVSDQGIAQCLDAKTGEKVWQQRLGGNYSASLTLADNRIYVNDENGKTFVFAPGKEYQELAVNELEGRTLSSLSFSGGAIYLRTDKHLYRIEQKK